MKKTILLPLVLLFLAGCCHKPKEEDKEELVTFVGAEMSKPERIIIRLICLGDVSAYVELYNTYRYYDSHRTEDELLPYALIMADKYGLPQAYVDVFYCLQAIHRGGGDPYSSLDPLHENARRMALEYLRKAYELGDRNAANELRKYYEYGKYVKKDTVIAKRLDKWTEDRADMGVKVVYYFEEDKNSKQ